jgi:hypothetical protein
MSKKKWHFFMGDRSSSTQACRDFQLRLLKKGQTSLWKRGGSPRRGNAQEQIGKTAFKMDLRRGEGRKLSFSLISLKKGQTLEKVSLFWRSFFV